MDNNGRIICKSNLQNMHFPNSTVSEMEIVQNDGGDEWVEGIDTFEVYIQ